ncbi:MAG: T9SS type A sorting domain-containing protein [Flavipsychrobacter sp.]|nr:T9SS type A sorting domain-containing protein [Flavipsychrobacter sp.]
MKCKKLLLSLSLLVAVHSAQAQYCTPDYLFGCLLGDNINTFSVTGVNSTSISSLNTSCASAGDYEDFTNDSVSFLQGGAYTVTINSEAANDFVEVYIDFDDNGSFSSSESVGGMNNMAVSPATSTFTLNIPGTAALGPHRMRVVVSGDSTYPGINPCPWNMGFTGYGGGEVHDYVADILGSTTTCDTPTNLTASAINFDGATFNWMAVTGATGYQYALNTSPTPPGSGTGTTNTSYGGTGLMSSTTYYFHLRTACGNNFSSWITISFNTSACPNPTSITQSAVTGSSATISWTGLVNVSGYLYTVTTSATPPASGTFTANNTGTVNGLSPNTLYYAWVRTVCGQADSSNWASDTFTTLPVSVVNVGGDDFVLQAYPNPVKHSVHIAAAGKEGAVAHIELTDLTGKLINRYQMEGKDLVVDMSGLSNGVYFIRYADDAHRRTVKVNKE